MKYFSILLATVMLSCTGSKNEQPQSEVSSEEAIPTPKGLTLIEGNDCQTCHHTKNKLIGPSYTAIASRYEVSNDTRKQLVSRIIKGGSGTWGDAQMNAHPMLSEEDANEMVNYILSLK